jgi:hypothetical protein
VAKYNSETPGIDPKKFKIIFPTCSTIVPGVDMSKVIPSWPNYIAEDGGNFDWFCYNIKKLLRWLGFLE